MEDKKINEQKKCKKENSGICFAFAIITTILGFALLMPMFIYGSGTYLVLSILFILAGIILFIIFFCGNKSSDNYAKLKEITKKNPLFLYITIGLSILWLATTVLAIFYPYEFLFFSLLFFIATLITLLIYTHGKKIVKLCNNRPGFNLAITSIVLDVVCVLCILLTVAGAGTQYFGLALILLIISITSPIAAIVVGIVALCQGKKNIGKSGVILAFTAIALPLITIAILILLFSTGVLVIRFM